MAAPLRVTRRVDAHPVVIHWLTEWIGLMNGWMEEVSVKCDGGEGYTCACKEGCA